MSAKEEVPVFYRDQDDSDEPPCQVVPRAEARLMKKSGLGYFECHGRQFRLHAIAPTIVMPSPFDTPIASTISLSETLANVGITEEWEPNPAGKVRRARYKIRMYPFVGDTQAPLARACR